MIGPDGSSVLPLGIVGNPPPLVMMIFVGVVAEVGVLGGEMIVYVSPVTGFRSLWIFGVLLLAGLASHDWTPFPVTGLRLVTSCFVSDCLRGVEIFAESPNRRLKESLAELRRELDLGGVTDKADNFFGSDLVGVVSTWKISLCVLHTLFLLYPTLSNSI